MVINSFRISGERGSNDEYIEIKNTSESEVDISSWKLAKKSASISSSPTYLRTVIPEETKLAPGESLTIAHPDCSCSFDLSYATTTGSVPSGVAADNTIIIFDQEKGVIDKVGFGTAADFEAAAISKSPESGEIYARKNSGQDTDNNKEDFYLSYTPPKIDDSQEPSTPKEEAVPSKSATIGAKIILTEFLPNPERSDAEGEWIEIYNTGSDANISGYIVADRVGSPKKYKLPEGTVIKSKQYLAFYSGKTPISLNNDGDAVELQSADGVVFNYTPNSGKGPEGASFALVGGSWSWTAKPTPGRANIIEAVNLDKKTGEKSGSEVLGLVDESQLPTQEDITKSQAAKNNDQLMGYGLIALAIIGGISYTLYINKEKLRDFYYHQFRKRDHLSGTKIRQNLKGRRDISADR